MAIFNSFISLPEGRAYHQVGMQTNQPRNRMTWVINVGKTMSHTHGDDWGSY